MAARAGLDVISYCVDLAQHGVYSGEMLEYGNVRLRTEDLPIERIKDGARLPRNVSVPHPQGPPANVAPADEETAGSLTGTMTRSSIFDSLRHLSMP